MFSRHQSKSEYKILSEAIRTLNAEDKHPQVDRVCSFWMGLLSRRRRLVSRTTTQQHRCCPAFPGRILAVLVTLAFIVVDNNMCEPIRSFMSLQQRRNFVTAFTSTTGRLQRPEMLNKRMAAQRSFSSLLSTTTAPVILPSTGRLPFGSRTNPTVFTTRLFGSKRGVPENPLGTVAIYNEQDAIPDIDEAALRTTVERISKILGYETYDVTLLLVNDEEMRETNLESRGIDAPTDILSFPFHEPVKAGLLEEPEFDVPDYYTLGDMVVDVPYVIRRCKEDLEYEQELEAGTDDEDDESSLVEDDDRGVSGAMASVQDPEKRIRMLLVHGMLHLVGYDHIEDDDYVEMVEKEEELLRELGEL